MPSSATLQQKVALKILELFGYSPRDDSKEARLVREEKICPFVAAPCDKSFGGINRTVHGVCSVELLDGRTTPVCPKRFYGRRHEFLSEVATDAFGPGVELIPPGVSLSRAGHDSDTPVLVFGHQWNREVRLPGRGTGTLSVDWILARLNSSGDLADFVAVEVQSIDTTGTYRGAWEREMDGQASVADGSGLNWANVRKRILPQLIDKGHILRRERLCRSGLYFVCPEPVFDQIRDSLGAQLLEYPPQPGSVTFLPYSFGPPVGSGTRRELVRTRGKGFTTTVDQIVNAFAAPQGLPPIGAYEQALRERIRGLDRGLPR